MQSSDNTNASLEPVVGRNLISVILTDLINVFIDPSWASLMASFVDLSAFIALPLMGGYVNATVFYNYEKDPLTYQHANLDSEYLYASSMLFAKDAVFTATGRPDFFDISTNYQQKTVAPVTAV